MKSVSGIWKTAILWKFAVRRRWTDIRREEGHLSDCLFSRGKGWRWAERGTQARNHEVWAFMAKYLQHVSACGMHFPVTLRRGQENFFGISSTERWAVHVDKFCLSNESFLVTKTGHLCVRSSQMERSKFLPAAKERRLCQFRQPMGICTESERVIYTCDAQTNSIKICTKMVEYAKFLNSVGQLFDIFSIHYKGTGYSVKSADEALSLVRQCIELLERNTNEIRMSTGITSATNGPQGHVSARTVASVTLLEWGPQRLFNNLQPFN